MNSTAKISTDAPVEPSAPMWAKEAAQQLNVGGLSDDHIARVIAHHAAPVIAALEAENLDLTIALEEFLGDGDIEIEIAYARAVLAKRKDRLRIALAKLKGGTA